MPMRNRISGILIVAVLLFAASVALASGKELKVNLVMGDGTLMLYSGSNDGVKVGDKLTVMRNNKEIGTIEITRVEPTYSVAKVVSSTDEIREMDLIVRPITGAGLEGASGMKSDDKAAKSTDKKADKKADEKADKKDDKEEKAEKKSSKKTSTKKKTSKKEDTAKDDKEEKADSKSDKKADKKSDDKKEETKTETVAAKPAKTIRDFHFPSIGGAVGLYQMPTAFVADAGSGGLSLYTYKDSRNASGSSTGGTDKDAFSYLESSTVDTKAISFAYAFNQNIEISGAQINRDATINVNSTDYFTTIQASSSAKIKATIIGVKFNPRKKYLLKGDTHKDFQYAFGVQNMNISGGADGDDDGGTSYYAAVAFPTSKMIFHGNVYKTTGGTPGAKKWGSMFGLEAPFTNRAEFIADVDRFNGVSTYVLGVRYLFSDKAALSLGFHDITESNTTMLNGSILF